MTVHRVSIRLEQPTIMSLYVTTEQPNEGPSQSGWIVRSVNLATMAGRTCHSVVFVTMRLIIGVLMCVLVLIIDMLSFA